MMIILLSRGILPVSGVISPLDKVSEELKLMQETVSSVQESLVTSVALLQDKLAEFTEKTSGIIDTKLSSLEQQVEQIKMNLASITENTEIWSDIEPKVNMCSEKVSSVEGKIDEYKMSHDDGISQLKTKFEILPKLDTNIAKLNQKMASLGSQLKAMDTSLITVQNTIAKDSGRNAPVDKLSIKVDKIESKLKNMSTSIHHRRFSRGHNNHNSRKGHRINETTGMRMCKSNKKVLKEIQDKVEIIWQAVEESDKREDSMPRFEYLRSEASPQIGDNYNEIRKDIFSEHEEKGNHMPKLAIPFKRVNKRLTEITSDIKTWNGDILREISDFRAMFSEFTHERNFILQGYSKDFASLQQCCSGHTADYNKFVAQVSPVVDRMDRWMTSWENMASQKFDRILQQNSYDHDTISKGQKEMERMVVEGFDRCKTVISDAVDHEMENTINEAQTNITMVHTEKKNKTDINSQLSDEPNDTTSFFHGCENTKFVQTLESKVFRVGNSQQNEGRRDFNIRSCDQETRGGGWTVIQRRGDYGEPKVNFTRDWKDYKHGFGDLNGEFWFGNDYISKLTLQTEVMLRVELEAHDGRAAWAEYDTFRVENEALDYRVWVGGYTGNASDSLSAHNGYKFSTIDKNNDLAPKCCPCAPAYGGGWWFYSCFEANLNGEYLSATEDNGYYRGIIWELWLGDLSLKSAKMMIRPHSYHVGYATDP